MLSASGVVTTVLGRWPQSAGGPQDAACGLPVGGLSLLIARPSAWKAARDGWSTDRVIPTMDPIALLQPVCALAGDLIMTGSCVVIRHRLALLLATMALAGGVAFPSTPSPGTRRHDGFEKRRRLPILKASTDRHARASDPPIP
jgi:hypothetical protein